MQAGVAQKALSLLLRFPFNNLLHAQVTSLVLHALDSGTPAIVDHLFNACNLVSTPLIGSLLLLLPLGQSPFCTSHKLGVACFDACHC